MHAWTDSTLRQLFKGMAVFNRISGTSYARESSVVCTVWVWMQNPDLLPLSVQCNFLPANAGPTLRLPSPPETREAELIFHIDEHHDWAPREHVSVPLIQQFTWTPGVLDDRPALAVVDGQQISSLPEQQTRLYNSTGCRERNECGCAATATRTQMAAAAALDPGRTSFLAGVSPTSVTPPTPAAGTSAGAPPQAAARTSGSRWEAGRRGRPTGPHIVPLPSML